MRKVIFILFLIPFLVFSQYSFQFQPPKTPDVYQMEKYGNPEINLYTGRPSINIPLYTIEYGDIKVPLQISYNSNGIRADEEASRVGLGWYMETPMIVQNVQGYDDLTMNIMFPDYYYNYKSAYIVDPQPSYWYDHSYPPNTPNTGGLLDRLNISNSMKASPTDHLNDYFMAKVKGDGHGFLGVSTFYPINKQLYNYDLENTNNYSVNFDIELDIFTMNFNGERLIFYKKPSSNDFVTLNKKNNYKIYLEKISNQLGNPKFRWTITNPSGIKYIFEEQNDSKNLKPYSSYFYSDNLPIFDSNNVYQTYPFFNNDLPLRVPAYSQNPNINGSVLSGRNWKLSRIIDTKNNSINYFYNPLAFTMRSQNSVSGKCSFLDVWQKVINRFDNSHPANPLSAYSPIARTIGDILDVGKYIECESYAPSYTLSSANENSIISKITFGNSSVDFTTSPRIDIPTDEKFDNITIKNNNLQVKKIDFINSYYPDNHALYKRMKLDGLKINDKTYTFEYNSTNPPTKYVDYWGYFNGLNNNTPFINPFRLYKDKSSIPSWTDYFYNLVKDSENKSAHPENCKTGILEKIIYPTGGYTKYDYELNTFDNYFFPNFDNKISVLLNTVNLSHQNNDTDYSNRSSQAIFLTQNAKIEGTISLSNVIATFCPYEQSYLKIVKIPTEWLSSYNTGVNARETFWNLVDQNQLTVETLYSNTNFSTTNPINFAVNLPTDGYYAARVVFDKRCASGTPSGYIKAAIKSTKYNDYMQTFSQGYGVRVKQTTDYDGKNNVIIKKYNYLGGKQIPYFNLFDNNDNYMRYLHQRYEIFNSDPTCTPSSNPPCSPRVYDHDNVYQSTGKKLTFSLYNIFQTNIFGNGDNVGYDKVEELIYNQDGTKFFGKKAYYFTNTPDKAPHEKFGIGDGVYSSDMDKFGLGIRETDIDNGKLLKMETYNDANALQKKDSMQYISKIHFDPKYCYNVKVVQNDSDFHLFIGSNGMIYETFPKYYFYYYPLKGRETLLQSKTETDYLNGNSLVTKTSYAYDINYNLPSNKDIVLPDNTNLSEGYGYTYSIDRFKQANILTAPIGLNKFKNGIQILNKGINYEDVTHYNPTSETTYKIADSNIDTIPDIIYNKYDDKSNILQYTSKSGVPTTIIWGYNQTQPIAKIEGAKYDDVKTLQVVLDVIAASNADAIDPTKEADLIAALDRLRDESTLKGYQISTYTYDPLIGVTSITPPNGIREIYQYDTANRLEKVIDINGNILKEYKYNYKQQ